MKPICLLIPTLFIVCIIAFHSCDIPYTNEFGPGDLDRLLEQQGQDTICLDDGFDTACIRVIRGKDGRDGKDGTTLIAIKEVPIEVVVEKIVETVVTNTEIVEVPVVVERVVERIQEVEVPIEVFVTETVEVIKEVIVEKEVVVEKEVIVEVPIETIVEVITEVVVEKEVVVEVQRDKSVFKTPEYLQWIQNKPPGRHPHDYPHNHGSYGDHTHWFVHPDTEQDDFQTLHNNFSHE